MPHKNKPVSAKASAAVWDHEVVGTTTLGERGQVVIPADIRKELNLIAGDKLIVMVKAGALHMMKADILKRMISKMSKQLVKFRK